MRIDDYEFEEEKTLISLADLLSKLADNIRNGERLEIPMPSLREGLIELELGEPIETGIEVNLRKNFIHLSLNLSWQLVKTKEDET